MYPVLHYYSVNRDSLFPPQEDRREQVPQGRYECGNIQKGWNKKQMICFSTRGSPGVKLSDAIAGKFEGIDCRDGFPFGEDCRGITIRIHFPGYHSSTHVEKALKERARAGGTSRARSMQLSTKDYKVPSYPITKSKLVQEVSKRIQWHIGDLLNNPDLFPFDDSVGGKWHLGQGMMKFEYMTITGLDNVSSGSWSPAICIDKHPACPGERGGGTHGFVTRRGHGPANF